MEVYFDNPATSWPKPEAVYQAVDRFLREVGANPGRSGHRRSLAAGRIVYEAREAVAELMHAPDPAAIVFTLNVTDSLNLAMKGILKPGDHVITTSMEHNSVMRPLTALRNKGVIELTELPCSPAGELDPAAVGKAMQGNTRMIVMSHASNVVGTIQPVQAVAALARERGVLTLIDGAQSAGSIPVDVRELDVDIYAFTGHKGLLGPQGTGGMYIREGIAIEPWREGGTGSRSEEDLQPDFLPDSLEAGTANTVGLAGLAAGVRYVRAEGVEKIQAHEQNLFGRLLDGMRQYESVIVYGPHDPKKATPVLSFNVAGMDGAEIGFRLDRDYNIACRTGLHCAPHAHKTIGSFPEGTVRFGLSHFNTLEEVDYVVSAVGAIIGKTNRC